MSQFTRRKFLEGAVLSGAVAISPRAVAGDSLQERHPTSPINATAVDASPAVDFRYAPRLQQATICFPNDPYKTLVGQRGDLRYGFATGNLLVGMEDFATICEFSLAGMQDDQIVSQKLDAPGAPIVRTIVERSTATMELIVFATNHAQEGRVDNVLITIRPKAGSVSAVPRISIRSCVAYEMKSGGPVVVVDDVKKNSPFLIAMELNSSLGYAAWWEERGYTLYLPHGEAERSSALQYFVRFPQEGQPLDAIEGMLTHPDNLLDEVRTFWNNWKPFGTVVWNYPGRSGEFLTACARNIQQSREVKKGRLVFQVGPTVYRNLWIADGNFLLEAARYLGYDKEADEGMLAEWSKQQPSGQVVAASGGEHWKDTAIAMFTLVRQCELKQDWQSLRDLEPNVRRAIEFLIQIRDQARSSDTTNGKYGLLPPGFADGGIGGVRSEFTNTVWTLAGLKAVANAAELQKIDSLKIARTFFDQLYAAFSAAARAEMARHPDGFEYLPMLAHDDPAWHDPDPWNRPRPQTAQWALSHAIFPGEVFAKDDPIVTGQIALLRSCTREDIPAETGWLWHESVWNYNASFAAHVYLWAGLSDLADRTFRGFLNHASPLYCWREEQPLQQALAGQDWGDMPHNWASAECVRYLRHMLILEDGQTLRLLAGMVGANIETRKPFKIENTPTRFGRVSLSMEPEARLGWKLQVSRNGPYAPATVELPLRLGTAQFHHIETAEYRKAGAKILVAPDTQSWTAFWR